MNTPRAPHPSLQAEPQADVWGDESSTLTAAFAWAESRVVRSSDPKSTAQPASQLSEAAGVTITPEGIGADAALRVFQEVLEPAIRAQDDPMNLAYIPAAPTIAAIAFDVVTASANAFGGTWEAGAGAVWAENQALEWIIGLLGWPTATAAGCFVSGGTIGNLSALAAAREDAATRRGRPRARWQVACSTQAHSSVAAAARVLDAEVVTIPEDGQGHLTGEAIRAAIADPGLVFAVVATAGTTNAGLIDELPGIADVCEQFGYWLHVDGAYGGAGLAAPGLRPKYAGIERANSFIVDPHKWLFAPYDCCALVYRDGATARAAHAQRASYLDHIDREAPNPCDLAIHLSRRARGLPLWFSLATHGTRKYAEAIDRTVDTAMRVAGAIQASDHLRLVVAPELSVLVFDRPGWTEAMYRAWSHDLATSGVLLCVPTRWRGRIALRLAFVNPATEADRVVRILEQTTAPQVYPAP